MKPLKLTKEHKSKLLEMCQVLFPKYKFGFENDVADLGMMEYHKDDEEWFFIHWFEFCMTHLAEKIDCDLAHNIIYMKRHPVDYLYGEFKKLKL